MKTIFNLTFKSAGRDPFLLLWSIILPIGGAIGLGVFIKSPDYPEHILTGMIAVSILFYSFMTTSFAILTQRRRGVYNLLRVTPMPLWKYVCSISGAWTLISFLCAMLVLLSGILALKINISNTNLSGNIEYSAHVSNIGWQDYVSNGAISGTTGQGL